MSFYIYAQHPTPHISPSSFEGDCTTSQPNHRVLKEAPNHHTLPVAQASQSQQLIPVYYK